MKALDKIRALFCGPLLWCALFLFHQKGFPEAAVNRPSLDGNFTVGSGYCQRCHESLYQKWSADDKRKPCESCHGPGRNHVLAPTVANILKSAEKNFMHKGPAGPAPLPQEKLKIELFVMSYCPYGIAALNTLLPLVDKWKGNVDLTLYYIAHRRGEKDSSRPSPGDIPLPSEKCEADGADLDGTDRYVSLHGLPEVLEDLRQIIIAREYQDRFFSYLAARNQDIRGDWKAAARAARLTEQEILRIGDLSDSRPGDSLFEANIREAEKRGVNGSPTLFINGREYTEAVSPYPVERYFCQQSVKQGRCKGFAECGFDFDCKKPGMEGTCVNPMKPVAKCSYAKAALFLVFVLNDEQCRTCHTGNILMEIMRRFPGAAFRFIPIDSDSGRAMINRYGIKTYPAFLFDTAAAKSKKFLAIQHTFDRVHDKFLLKDYVVKSYHYLFRPFKQDEIALFGSFENPPFIETLRDFRNTVLDSLENTRASIYPFAVRSEKGPGKGPWTDAYESPYGPDEVRAGVNQLCVFSKYPLKAALDYMVCRGHDVQKRFETGIPEKRDEWKACAAQMKLDTTKIRACEEGEEGKALFEKSADMGASLGLEDPGPMFLLNNNFRIAGYNPMIRKIILREMRKP
jgi:hypothetical protein